VNGRPPDLKVIDGDGEPLPQPALRGTTTIPDKVVARLTEQAAREALTRRQGPGHTGLRPPRSTARVRRGGARIDVSVDLTYPVDIAGVCTALARDVTERVHHLTGLHIDDLTVSVHRLVLNERLRRRRVR
jgi:hypothetical protein